MATVTSTTFHEGELAVQRRAGVQHVAAKVGHNISSFVPYGYMEFLDQRPFVVVAAVDGEERIWASPLTAEDAALEVLDERRVRLTNGVDADDPLADAFHPGTAVGLIAIEFDSRTRIRINGTVTPSAEGLIVDVREVFANCPKYIQRRRPTRPTNGQATPATTSAAIVTPEASKLIREADTFFTASHHPVRGADASHRGGRPGFVTVGDDGRTLLFPDYSGNRMFQTLGNLTADPRIGLLFVDWDTGGIVQISGRAEIIWAEAEVGRRAGAERLVRVAVDDVSTRSAVLRDHWQLIEPSPLNPTVAGA